jgi:hypothetical protein
MNKRQSCVSNYSSIVTNCTQSGIKKRYLSTVTFAHLSERQILLLTHSLNQSINQSINQSFNHLLSYSLAYLYVHLIQLNYFSYVLECNISVTLSNGGEEMWMGFVLVRIIPDWQHTFQLFRDNSIRSCWIRLERNE